MKIVYFNYLYDLYGISIGSTRKAEELMRALQAAGHEVKIYWRKRQPAAGGGIGTVTKNFLKRFLSRYLHDPKQLLLNFVYFIQEYRIITRERPDLIITRLELYLFSSHLVAKLKKIPIVVEADGPVVYEARTFHPEFMSLPYLGRAIERWNFSNARLSICVSNQAREHFIQHGAPAAKLRVVTNGADTDRFRPDIPTAEIRRAHHLDGKVIIGFVGSFHYWHGVENLIALIERTAAVNEAVGYLLVGAGGPMKTTLESYIAAKNLAARVKMTGYVDYGKIPAYIAAMDIVIAPYPPLPFFYYSPVKLYEYMACGKPVIASRLGQIAEVIQHGVNGVLIEPGNLDEMVEQVNKLVGDRQRREQIGKNARATIVANYSWRKKADEWSALCQGIINGRFTHPE